MFDTNGNYEQRTCTLSTAGAGRCGLINKSMNGVNMLLIETSKKAEFNQLQPQVHNVVTHQGTESDHCNMSMTGTPYGLVPRR